MSEPRFNLVEEKWLPACTLGGEHVTLGLRDTLLRAHELAELRDPSPLTSAALLRLLLAALHAAHGRPWNQQRRAEYWRRGRWDAETVDGYLEQWRSRFDLCDARFPFYQDGSFELPQPVTIARLAPQLASGNNATLFDHTLDSDPPAVELPACARWVVTFQSFTLGGGQGATSARYDKHPNLRHAPPALGALTLLRGRNLFETLLLNLLPYSEREPIPSGEDDRPLWERDEFPWPREQPPPGYLAYLTWPIRCLRLRPEAGAEGWVVRFADVAQGPYFAPGTGWHDPFFALRMSSSNEVIPLRLSADRALWRDSGSLFGFCASPKPARGAGQVAIAPQPRALREVSGLEAELRKLPLSCVVVGLDFDQAKVNLWRAEELPISWELLNDRDCLEYVEAGVRDAETIGRALQGALLFLAQALLQSEEPGKADRGVAGGVARGWGAEAEYWPALEAPFRSLLADLPADADGAIRNWRRAAIDAANRAFDLAERQAGSGAREMRARVAARRLFHRLTWEWQSLERAAQQREEETHYAAS